MRAALIHLFFLQIEAVGLLAHLYAYAVCTWGALRRLHRRTNPTFIEVGLPLQILGWIVSDKVLDLQGARMCMTNVDHCIPPDTRSSRLQGLVGSVSLRLRHANCYDRAPTVHGSLKSYRIWSVSRWPECRVDADATRRDTTADPTPTRPDTTPTRRDKIADATPTQRNKTAQPPPRNGCGRDDATRHDRRRDHRHDHRRDNVKRTQTWQSDTTRSPTQHHSVRIALKPGRCGVSERTALDARGTWYFFAM
ncbi:hypothetical protein B0H19DRAFT_1060634 [Mycena capillaripes]|nr:hypothetical protein B0H19DRAFT_1060634 [Mycena capillaripes]